HGIRPAVQLLDTFDGAALGQVGNDLALFLGRPRVLVVQLGYQKLQDLVLAELVTLGKAPLIHLVLVKHTAADTDAHSLLSYCPRVSTRCSMLLAVFMISTLV